MTIERRPNGETVWRCSGQHEKGKNVHGNRWDGLEKVEEAIRRHLALYHPDVNADREIDAALKSA